VTDNQHAKPNPENDAGAAAERVARFCRGLTSALRFELDVQAHGEGEDVIVVNLTGPDRPLLLANTAAVLNSIEYLVNKAFRTGKDEEIATIILESDNYRKQREAELKLLAQIAAEKVLGQRRPLHLQPMTPKERRIVHLALAAIEGVRSESDGEGERRSITIFPAD
jgi:spoIIIJ-associated protein